MVSLNEMNRIDAWCEKLLNKSCTKQYEFTEITVSKSVLRIFPLQNYGKNRLFQGKHKETGEQFFLYFQPTMRTNAPLLVHTPGYLHEACCHPELVFAGYNVLHIQPLNYFAPDREKEDVNIFERVLFGEGELVYEQWLEQCIVAVEFIRENLLKHSVNIGFFGTSQGGGAALLLASIFKDRGAACVCSDEPFFIGFCEFEPSGIYTSLEQMCEEKISREEYCRRFENFDVLNHLHRIQIPVALSASTGDEVCTYPRIRELFDRLDCEKSFTLYREIAHGYNQQFIKSTCAWMDMHL